MTLHHHRFFFTLFFLYLQCFIAHSNPTTPSSSSLSVKAKKLKSSKISLSDASNSFNSTLSNSTLTNSSQSQSESQSSCTISPQTNCSQISQQNCNSTSSLCSGKLFNDPSTLPTNLCSSLYHLKSTCLISKSSINFKTAVIIGSVVGGVMILAILSIFFYKCCYRNRRSNSNESPNDKEIFKPEIIKISTKNSERTAILDVPRPRFLCGINLPCKLNPAENVAKRRGRGITPSMIIVKDISTTDLNEVKSISTTKSPDTYDWQKEWVRDEDPKRLSFQSMEISSKRNSVYKVLSNAIAQIRENRNGHDLKNIGEHGSSTSVMTSGTLVDDVYRASLESTRQRELDNQARFLEKFTGKTITEVFSIQTKQSDKVEQDKGQIEATVDTSSIKSNKSHTNSSSSSIDFDINDKFPIGQKQSIDKDTMTHSNTSNEDVSSQRSALNSPPIDRIDRMDISVSMTDIKDEDRQHGQQAFRESKRDIIDQAQTCPLFSNGQQGFQESKTDIVYEMQSCPLYSNGQQGFQENKQDKKIVYQMQSCPLYSNGQQVFHESNQDIISQQQSCPLFSNRQQVFRESKQDIIYQQQSCPLHSTNSQYFQDSISSDSGENSPNTIPNQPTITKFRSLSDSNIPTITIQNSNITNLSDSKLSSNFIPSVASNSRRKELENLEANLRDISKELGIRLSTIVVDDQTGTE